MTSVPADQTPHRESQLAYRFGVTWFFLLVGASVGALLRRVALAPQAGVVPGDELHAHSHVAFLGWDFGAFFVAAQHHFVAPERSRSYDALFRDLAQYTQILAVVPKTAAAGMVAERSISRDDARAGLSSDPSAPIRSATGREAAPRCPMPNGGACLHATPSAKSRASTPVSYTERSAPPPRSTCQNAA